MRFAAVLADDVKAKLGPCPRKTNVNRLVAWELLQKACVARDVRKVDRNRFCTMAVDMVFVETELDVTMAAIRRSRPIQERIADMGTRDTWLQRLIWPVLNPGLAFTSN
jgi:hypothetical protein